ncbi:broad-complex core protein [Microdochium nivale]|nr:broad-complex core protein [Microdochium nivale]
MAFFNMQQFMAGNDDDTHAYINGLVSQPERQCQRVAKCNELDAIVAAPYSIVPRSGPEPDAASRTTVEGTGINQTRKRRHTSGDHNNDDDGTQRTDSGDEESRSALSLQDPGASKITVACPFFKYDEQKYARCAERAYSGWYQTKRHITEEHQREVQHAQCHWCRRLFPQKGVYETHTSKNGKDMHCGEAQDEIAPWPAVTHEVLRKSVPTGALEMRWRHLFRSLFPQCTTVPSPYTLKYERAEENKFLDALTMSSHDISSSCLEQMSTTLPESMSAIQQEFMVTVTRKASLYILAKRQRNGLVGVDTSYITPLHLQPDLSFSVPLPSFASGPTSFFAPNTAIFSPHAEHTGTGMGTFWESNFGIDLGQILTDSAAHENPLAMSLDNMDFPDYGLGATGADSGFDQEMSMSEWHFDS